MKRKLGQQTVIVLKALAEGCRYGFEIVESTETHTATVYRSLRRLEKLGFVRSHWEGAAKAVADGRPRRKYYTVNRYGRAALEEAVAGMREIIAGSPTGLKRRDLGATET